MTKVLSDQTALVVKMVQMVPREEKDPEEKLVLSETPVKRVNLVFLVYLDTQDVPVKKEQEDLKVQLDDQA